jgi:hypothetical protein
MEKLTGITAADYTLPGPVPKREAMTPENQLRAESCSCAAGPWRYDIENAKIGEIYWLCYGEGAYEVGSMNMIRQWRNIVNCYMPQPLAFAEINPPEEKP